MASRFFRAIIEALTVLLAASLCASTFAEDAGESSPSRFLIENKYISYEVKLREGKDAEVTIVNKGLDRKHTFSSPVFMVMTEERLADISRCRVHKVGNLTSPEGVQTAQIVATCPRAGLAMSLLYELEADNPFLKKRLSVSKLEPGEVVVNRIDVDVLHLPEPKDVIEFPGLGQPLYYRDLFFGVEYPACTILHDGRGRIRVGYEYALPVGLTAVGSHVAVIGVAPENTIEKAFMKYVDTIRLRPPRPFVLWNSWYDLRDFDEKACLESLRLLREKFCQPHGIRLDSIVLDDGWDDHRSLWRASKDRFPSEFTKIEQEALKISSGIGFWLSPWGGYGQAQKERITYGTAQGFELLQSPGFRQEGFCLAAPIYNSRFRECAMGFLRGYATTYFKFDGFPSFCQDAAHRHRIGLYSQMALTDAFITILDSLKKQKPAVFINITTGTWQSPWWLEHADSVWMQGADYGHDGWGSVRQRSITYKDWRMHTAFREGKAQYPINALMTVGIVKGRYDTDSYRAPDQDESEKDWQDHVMMNLGMGTMHLELYISPSIMSDKELAFLAEKVRWWTDNAGIFSHTKMVLGNPHKGEVYAYVHFPQREPSPQKGFIFIRNPSLEKRKGEIPFDDSVDLPKPAQRVRLGKIYPTTESLQTEVSRGESVSLELEPLETRVLEVGWDKQ